MIKELKISLKCYFITFLIFLLSVGLNLYFQIYKNFWIISLIFITTVIIELIIFYLTFSNYDFQFAVRSAFLGCTFCLGIFIKLYAPECIQIFGSYMCVMAFFHYSEFVIITLIKPELVTTDSFMLNHSPEYIYAAISSWLEFFVECYFFPQFKTLTWLSNIGVGVCVAGEILRKTSMLTAGKSFNHNVQFKKAKDHELVTTGVYGLFRHPSYVGWFYWSIGTQITLLNPICVIAYTVASWCFFNQRICVEEYGLLNMFGKTYLEYQSKVSIGIPFIRGYITEKSEDE